jgi:hypothetical protein
MSEKGLLLDKSKPIFSSYEKFVIAILALLQFTVVPDFMVLSPLGATPSPINYDPKRVDNLVYNAWGTTLSVHCEQ